MKIIIEESIEEYGLEEQTIHTNGPDRETITVDCPVLNYILGYALGCWELRDERPLHPKYKEAFDGMKRELKEVNNTIHILRNIPINTATELKLLNPNFMGAEDDEGKTEESPDELRYDVKYIIISYGELIKGIAKYAYNLQTALGHRKDLPSREQYKIALLSDQSSYPLRVTDYDYIDDDE